MKHTQQIEITKKRIDGRDTNRPLVTDLLRALIVSRAYLAKAVADDLMTDCVRPPLYALNLVDAVIARAERRTTT